jgi:hypothetical protein
MEDILREYIRTPLRETDEALHRHHWGGQPDRNRRSRDEARPAPGGQTTDVGHGRAASMIPMANRFIDVKLAS